MRNTTTSLTGLWNGQYSFPSGVAAPVAFVATFLEARDWLGGSISERALLGAVKGRMLYATVSGQRNGRDVNFTKRYETRNGPCTQVGYVGLLSQDGLEIDGEWSTAGWAGRFLMIRARPAARAERA